jgi:hypothetical protein
MAYGFRPDQDFSSVVGWCLEQVTIDMYHVMFHFNSGWALLNIASSFSYRSAGGDVQYSYRIYGPDDEKRLNVAALLRQSIKSVRVVDAGSLELSFGNGDVLLVHDDPDMRSWWFMGGSTEEDWTTRRINISDWELDDLSDSDVAWRAAAQPHAAADVPASAASPLRPGRG